MAAQISAGQWHTKALRTFKNLRKTNVFPWGATGALPGVHAGISSHLWYTWRGTIVFLRFYKGSQLTVRFLQPPPRPQRAPQWSARGGLQNPKENQRFLWGTPGDLLGAHGGINFRPWYQWRGTTDFLTFYKGFRLTVRFLGGCFFGRGGNACFSNGFEGFWVRSFFWTFAVRASKTHALFMFYGFWKSMSM